MGIWYNSPTVYWVSQQPPEMLCKDVPQGTVSGSEDSTVWPSIEHFDFSQEATFGEKNNIFCDMTEALLANQE